MGVLDGSLKGQVHRKQIRKLEKKFHFLNSNILGGSNYISENEKLKRICSI